MGTEQSVAVPVRRAADNVAGHPNQYLHFRRMLQWLRILGFRVLRYKRHI